MAASSSYSNSYQPVYGRLNAVDGWCAKTNGSDEYLQVDLGQLYEVCGVATQGGGQYDAIDEMTCTRGYNESVYVMCTERYTGVY